MIKYTLLLSSVWLNLSGVAQNKGQVPATPPNPDEIVLLNTHTKLSKAELIELSKLSIPDALAKIEKDYGIRVMIREGSFHDRNGVTEVAGRFAAAFTPDPLIKRLAPGAVAKAEEEQAEGSPIQNGVVTEDTIMIGSEGTIVSVLGSFIRYRIHNERLTGEGKGWAKPITVNGKKVDYYTGFKARRSSVKANFDYYRNQVQVLGCQGLQAANEQQRVALNAYLQAMADSFDADLYNVALYANEVIETHTVLYELGEQLGLSPEAREASRAYIVQVATRAKEEMFRDADRPRSLDLGRVQQAGLATPWQKVFQENLVVYNFYQRFFQEQISKYPAPLVKKPATSPAPSPSTTTRPSSPPRPPSQGLPGVTPANPGAGSSAPAPQGGTVAPPPPGEPPTSGTPSATPKRRVIGPPPRVK